MKSFNLEEVKEFSLTSHVRKVICEYANTKALLICFESGKSVPACTMESDVFFYTVEGMAILDKILPGHYPGDAADDHQQYVGPGQGQGHRGQAAGQG